ncbi:hypothetical protein EPO05_04685 [Patescibacteria group bacterium]|nr:MAG: hypothetical protein EPO05_04685 [Patescibacteria group bacterium]
MELNCSELGKFFSQILTQKAQFDQALKVESVDQAEELSQELKASIERLSVELVWPFSEFSHKTLKEQYESQVQILVQNGILERLPSGERYITGIDDEKYFLPTLGQIIRQIMSRPELKDKISQGFTKLQVTPFALSLPELADAVAQTLLDHHKAGKLFAAKRNQDDPKEQLTQLKLPNDCETNPGHSPLSMWEGYTNDKVMGSGGLVYFPKRFDPKKHQGKTKQQLLSEKSTFPGFLVTLTEPSSEMQPNIILGNRIRMNPKKYLQDLQSQPKYQHERGITPEEWLVRFLVHLEQTDQVIDVMKSSAPDGGNRCYHLGAYFVSGNASVSEVLFDGLNNRVFLKWGHTEPIDWHSETYRVVGV